MSSSPKPLTPAQIQRSQELIAQILRLLSAPPRAWDERRILDAVQALEGEAVALDLRAFLSSLDRFRALLGTAGSTPEAIMHSVPMLKQAANQLQHALNLLIPPNPFARGSGSNQVRFDQVTTQSASIGVLANQDAVRRSSSQNKKIDRERLMAESIAQHMSDDELPFDTSGLLQGEDFLVEDDEVIEDFDAFLEEEIAGNSIFSPENPMKPQLLPEARSVRFEGSGLLMVFDQEADVTAALARSRAEGPFAELDETIDIDIQPIEKLTDVERAMRSLVDRLSRILTRLMDSLDLLLVGKALKEAIDVARQLNRIARIVGLFQLDNHLPMIAYLQGLLPLTTAPSRTPNEGYRERQVDQTQSARFLNQQQEMLACIVTLTGWLVEDIPGLDRERYESGFLTLYETLGWSPSTPSEAAPTRQGWALGQVMERIARQIYAGLQETLDGISRSLLDGQPEGFQLATTQLRKMAEALAGQQISDAVVHLSRLAELFRTLRPISPPVEQILSRFEALLSALSRWFPTLPLDGFRQHIRSLCNTFRFTQRQRTNPALASIEALRTTPASGSPQVQPSHTRTNPQQFNQQHQAKTITRARTNTNEIATGLMQLVAKLDALGKEALRAGQHHNLKPLLERLPSLPVVAEEARQRGLLAVAIALDVIAALLKHAQPTTNQSAALSEQSTPKNRHPISEAAERLEALLALAMDMMERGQQGTPDRTLLGNAETFLTIDRRWSAQSAALLQGLLLRELDQVLSGWRSQRHTQPASAVAAQFFLPEQHRPGLERLERIAQTLGSETLSEALITHQHSLPAILQDDNAPERLERAIQRVERFAREAIQPGAPPPPPQPPSEDQLKFASLCRRWLLRAIEQLDPAPESPENIEAATRLIRDLVASLLPRACAIGHISILGALCMLDLSASQLGDTHRDLTLRHIHLQRALNALSRQLQILAPDLTPDPDPWQLTPPPVEAFVRMRPASLTSPPAPQPSLAFPLPPRPSPLPPLSRPSPLLPPPTTTTPTTQQPTRTPEAAIPEIITRLQQRAACLGRTLQVTLPTPWPATANRSPHAWPLLAALEELASALIDRAWPSTRSAEMTWRIETTPEHLSVSLSHNGQALALSALREALDTARCLDAHSIPPEDLILALCSHPEAVLSLGLGPALAVSAALLRADQGSLSLSPSAEETPHVAAWILSVRAVP